MGIYVIDSIMDSIGDSIMDSIWNYVRDSVELSVRDSVIDSVCDSVRAYMATFFLLEDWLNVEHEKSKNPFQCMADLWDMGVIPVFLDDEVLLVTNKGVIDRYKID